MPSSTPPPFRTAPTHSPGTPEGSEAPAGEGRREQRRGSTERRSQGERRAQAEQALIEAAIRLFARRGVEQTSMADIGEEAGYSRALANHHFGSRAELVNRLARQAQSEFLANLRAGGGQDAQGLASILSMGPADDGEDGSADAEPELSADLVERLASRARPALLTHLGSGAGLELRALAVMVDTYLATVAHGSDSTRAFSVMWGASFPEQTPLRLVFAADDARFRRGVEQLVRLGQRNRTIGPGIDPVGAATAVVGMLRGIAAQFTVAPESVDLDATRTACTQFLAHALAFSAKPSPKPHQL